MISPSFRQRYWTCPSCVMSSLFCFYSTCLLNDSNTFTCRFATFSPSHPWQDPTLPHHASLTTCRCVANALHRPTVAHQASPCFCHTLFGPQSWSNATDSKKHVPRTRDTHTRARTAAYKQTPGKQVTGNSRVQSDLNTNGRERGRTNDEKEKEGSVKEELTG